MNDEEPNARDDELWLSPSEAGKLIPGGVSSATIRAWCHGGKIPGVIQTPSGRWRIPESAIEGVLKKVGYRK